MSGKAGDLAALKSAEGEKRTALLDIACETIAVFTDNSAETVKQAGFSDAELVRIFQHASDCYNGLASEKKILSEISNNKAWIIETLKCQTAIHSYEQGLNRLSATINTRALLVQNRRPGS